jgi:hypothetical protein
MWIEKIQEIALPNKYTKWYISIVGKTTPRIGVTEKHHILPRSFDLGGNTEKENLVELTTKEHFICHVLLTKMFPVGSVFRNKMIFALFNMRAKGPQHSKRYVTPRVYAKVKDEWRKLQSDRQRRVMSDPEHRKRVSEKRKQYWKDHPEKLRELTEKKIGRKKIVREDAKSKLKGDDRTPAQKACALAHGQRMKGKIPHNKGTKGQFGKRVRTPDGIFETGLLAAEHYGITSGTVTYRCKHKLCGFEYVEG